MASASVSWNIREETENRIRVEFSVTSTDMPDPGLFVWQVYTDEAGEKAILPLRVAYLSDIDLPFYPHPDEPPDGVELFRKDFFYMVGTPDQDDELIEFVLNRLQQLVDAYEKVGDSGEFTVTSA